MDKNAPAGPTSRLPSRPPRCSGRYATIRKIQADLKRKAQRVGTKSTTIAIVGGGQTGISVLTGIVRAAVDSRISNLHISLFERAEEIGTGPPHATRLPNAFLLNHEQNHMGSVNIELRQTADDDFHQWVQRNLATLAPLYPAYDLENAKGYVPRNLYGRYLIARYEETQAFAERHGITITSHNVEVHNISRDGPHFVVETSEASQTFDRVVLATGNWFRKENEHFKSTGRAFLSHQWESYIHNDAIPHHATMLISGTGLSAYDAAILALESSRYEKVIMTSRRGHLRKVRGLTKPYARKHLTLQSLKDRAGSEQPFRLQDLMQLTKMEIAHAYGHQVAWKEAYTTAEIIEQLREDIATVERNEELKWRSVYLSMSHEERHAIYVHLTQEEREVFQQKYYSLFQCIRAPMPITNAKKLLHFLDIGKLELVNGVQSVGVNKETGKFELWYANETDGTPILFTNEKEALGDKLKKHPMAADVYINATGIGRDIRPLPLYAKLAEGKIVELHANGGICVNMDTRQVMIHGKPHKNLYAIGTMTSGESILPYNSLIIAELAIRVGKEIVDSIGYDNSRTQMRTKFIKLLQREFA